MRRMAMALSMCLAAGAVPAAEPPREVLALRRQGQDAKGLTEVLYRFDQEHVTPAAAAAARGKEAAGAWAALDKTAGVLPVIARSPFGGGECAGSYWPKEVKGELLRLVKAPLEKQGLQVVFPELPEEARPEVDAPGAAVVDPDDPAPGVGAAPAPQARPFTPWPTTGFHEDCRFVLTIGLHHESIPYKGTRLAGDGSVVYFRSSRVNAWAVLFHAPSGCAFWAARALAHVDFRGEADPLNAAAATALASLPFADIGADNIPAQIELLPQLSELPAVDQAAMLAQTQRADAAGAVIAASLKSSAYTVTAWVLRYFNQKGMVQDFRIDPEQAKAAGCVHVNQRVAVRSLLLEQLRGVRSVQGCAAEAIVEQKRDLDIFAIGRQYAGVTGPIGGVDELILITELAADDPLGIFSRNKAGAVRLLGKCRVHIAEAMAVARYYAERQPPPVRGRGGGQRADPLRDAGKAALADLERARIELARKKAAS